MNLRRFVWLKFWIWFVPLAFISFLTFSDGAIAVGVSWWAVLLNGCAGVIISVGLAGLATGTGAYFVNLKWEHPSQLAASFGSLTFMLLATVLIGLSIFPIGSILYSGYPDAFLMTIHPILRWAALVALAGGLVVMHILVARVALSIGVKRLAKVVAI
jgi:hypothetical protein